MRGFAEIFHTCLEMMIAHVNAPFMARSVGNAVREKRTIEPSEANTRKDVVGAHGRFDPAESGSDHFEGAHGMAENGRSGYSFSGRCVDTVSAGHQLMGIVS